MLRLGVGGVQPERGGDQGREGLDVGTHHDDVPWLERRVVGQQPDQDLAEHLNLAVRPVRGVQDHAAVTRVEHRTGGLGQWRPVGRDVGLQSAEEGAGGWTVRPAQMLIHEVDPGGRQGELQLPCISTEVGQQAVTAQPLGVVVDPASAGRWSVPLQVLGHLLPQGRRGAGSQR